MNAERYTQSQVLCGLQAAWGVATGTDDAWTADTQIYTFMKADGSWDELDLADVFGRIERFFGFECREQEWLDFFGFDLGNRDFLEWERSVAPYLTFGALTKFIADRAPIVASFEAAPVFGRYCAGAGIFDGIRQVAARTTPYRGRFAPSARIMSVMRGKELDEFWTHLRWMTENSIPPLPSFWREAPIFAGILSVVLLIGSARAAWSTGNPLWLGAGLLGAAALFVPASLYRHWSNPLPEGIASFRDLAMLIAKLRGEAA